MHKSAIGKPKNRRDGRLLFRSPPVAAVVLLTAIMLSTSYFLAQASPVGAQGISGLWPAERFDNAGTRYNGSELQLYPPLIDQPEAVIGLDADTSGSNARIAPVVAADRLFWHEWGSNEAATFYTADMEGNVLWSYNAPEEIQSFSYPPKVIGNTVLVSARNFIESFQIRDRDRLLALDLDTGDLRWTAPVYTNLYLAQGDRVYLFWETPTDDQFFSALRLSDGEELYRQPAQYFRGYAFEPIIYGENLYLYEGSRVHAHRLSDGENIWSFHDEENSSTVTVHIAAASGMIIIGQGDRLVGINAETGQEIWQYEATNGQCWGPETKLVTDGVYVAQYGICGGEVHVSLVATGTPVWNQDLNNFPSRTGAGANGVLYLATEAGNSHRIQAFSLATGDMLQQLDVVPWAGELMIAGGKLYATDILGQQMVIYETGQDADGYLDSWDNDGNPVTNPSTQTEVHLTQRVGAGQASYGAEIQIAAFIGNEPATVRVYRPDDSVYKEATTTPDRHGHGFWVIPVEYSAAGYQYDVELGDGERLGRRTIRMPSDPSSNIRLVELLDGLSWANAPASINSLPAEITLELPEDFPSGPVEALLMLDSPQRGSAFIAGERRGNEVVFTVTRNNVVQGSFTISAVARAANVAAFSDDRMISFQAPGLPSFLPGQVTTVGHAPDGSIESVTYEFERDRPEPDPDGTIEAQIGQIAPYGGGYQVTVHVTTPPESDPEKAQERPHRVQVTGRDGAGNPISQDQISLPPNLDETPVQFELPQNGARPIEQIEVSALEPILDAFPDPQPMDPPLPPPPPPPLFCSDDVGPGPDDPDDEDNDPDRRWRIRDLFSVSTSVGTSASAVYYVGAGGGTSVSYDWINRQPSACVEIGARGGKELALGPSYSMNFGLNMRGPGHDAPASSGKKINITAAAGVGVDLSYTIPDNWQTSGFGTLSVGLTAAPKAGVSAGISHVDCADLTPQNPPPNSQRRECCAGPCNDPPRLPDLPGENHPDDTLSVVISNQGGNPFQRLDSWAMLARLARSAGYLELADYGVFRTRLDVLGLQMLDYPVDVALDELTPEQQRVVADYLYERTSVGFEMQARWPIIRSQWDRLMASSAQVLASGFYPDTMQMLDSYGISSRLVPVNFSPDEMTGLIIIPSGGLFGIADVQGFEDRLERFVSRGGTLLVMAQPENDSLDVLPGSGGLSQVGYIDDISCFQDAMTWKEYHPMLASMNSTTIDAHVDGFITELPPNARLLLERTKNQQGAFALYPYGEGNIVITNLYQDWALGVGQSSPQVRDLFRDVVRWAADPADLPDVRPGGSIQVPVEVSNHTPDLDAAQVRYILRDANQGEAERLDPVALNLEPGAGQMASPSFTLPQGPLGIWWLNYELLDADDRVIQEETLGSRFTLSGPPALSNSALVHDNLIGSQAAVSANTGEQTDSDIDGTTIDGAAIADSRIVTTQPPEAHVTPALDQVSYGAGEMVQLTLNIEIPDPDELTELRVVASLGDSTEMQFVPAQASQDVQFQFPADFNRNGLIFFGVYNEETGQGMVLDTIWTPIRGQEVTVTTDRFAYAPGDPVTLTVESIDTRNVYFQGPGIDREQEVSAGISTVQFTLPGTMASGPFTLRYNDGSTLRTVLFDVKGPRIRIDRIVLDETTLAVGSVVNGEVHLWSNRDIDVYMDGLLVEPGGNVTRAFVEPVTLEEGMQVVPISVPFNVGKGGINQLRIAISDRVNANVEYARVTRNLATNTPELMSARSDTIVTGAGQQTRLLLDWYSPVARTVDVGVYDENGSLLSRQIDLPQGFTTTELDLTLPGGEYDLVVAGVVDGILTSASALVVVESFQQLFLPEVQR